jgi:acetyl esterase/lipase
MTATAATPTLHIPARDIPVPAHLSPQAQAVLSAGRPEGIEFPPVDDHDAWRAVIAMSDEMIMSMMSARASQASADAEEADVDGVHVYVMTPHGTTADDNRVYLEIHGGAFIMGGGECCRVMGLNAIHYSGVQTYAVDYRMPPDYAYPAALDDCLAVYRALLRDHRPSDIILGGGSAGGNLAAALVLRARDEGLPLPAAVVLLTPAVDFTQSGDSFHTNAGVDTILGGGGGAMPIDQLYAPGQDLTNPYVSPLFGDFSKGFPPTLLATGTRDLLLSNTVRMHRALRAAGVEAELHVMEAAPHGGFQGTAPEDDDLVREVHRFVRDHWVTRA